MSDIDFDELDRAINKVVGKDDKKPETTATENTTDSPSRSTNGRFMDLVHPSSDMKSEAGETSMMSHSTSELDQSLQENNTSLAESGADTKKDIVIDKNEVAENAASLSSDQTEPDTTSMPDPLDFSPHTQKAESQETPESSATDTGESKNDTEPSLTPFLPDAPPVEKRPLGGWDPSAGEKDYSKVIDEIKHKTSDQESSPEETSIVLPPELEKELVQIEESSNLVEPDAADKASESDKKDDDTQEDQTEDTSSSPPTPSVEKKDKDISGLLATGSIPTQYKTTPSRSETSTPQDSHPLFDDKTTSVNASSKHSSKKSSTHVLRWVMIIIGLLLLGATIGAAAYVFISGNQAFPL